MAKGIVFRTKKLGGIIYLQFRNPFDGGKLKAKSTQTDNVKLAESIAVHISEAIHTTLDKMRNDYPQIVYDILEVKPLGKKIELAKKSFVGSKTLAKSPAAALGSKSSMEHYISSAKANEEVLEEVGNFKAQMEYWRGKAIAAQAALGRRISEAEANSGPRRVSKALQSFMETQIKSNGQWRGIVKNWLDRFAVDVGDVDVQTIGPEKVIGHLTKFETQSNLSDIYTYVVKFMSFATFQAFDSIPVKDWFERRVPAGEPEQWFWLTPEETRAMIVKMPPFWEEAATLQYGCGFRPEELPLLRSDAVTIKGTAASIALMAPPGRRLKSKRSRDAVNVPTWAIASLRNRLEAAKPVLFAFSDSGCFLPPHLKEKETDQDRAWDLWPSADDHEWSVQYLARLRKAAAAVLPALRASQVDSRTLRRTCGRELIKKYGLEQAAAVLRHEDVKTLRSHYADIMTSDVSTER